MLKLDKNVESWSGPIVLEPGKRTLKIIDNKKNLCSAHKLSLVGKHSVVPCHWLSISK